jgi:hypothetical protein
VPILAKKSERQEEALESALSDGTRLSGFVTAKQNRPPRDCGHCRWFTDGCSHPVVRIDPELRNRLQPNGNVKVDGDDCCNEFQPKKS